MWIKKKLSDHTCESNSILLLTMSTCVILEDMFVAKRSLNSCRFPDPDLFEV